MVWWLLWGRIRIFVVEVVEWFRLISSAREEVAEHPELLETLHDLIGVHDGVGDASHHGRITGYLVAQIRGN
jgi:hypothetical protein